MPILEWSTETNSKLSKNKVIKEKMNFGKEWLVSLEYKPNMQAPPNAGWKNIIHFTTGGDGWINDKGVCGSRYPAIWVDGNTNDKLHVTSCVNNDANYTQFPKIEDKWNTIVIGQRKRVDPAGTERFYYFIKINEVIIHETINSNPKEITGLLVYASDPWYVPGHGCLKNLVARTNASQGEITQ